MPDSISPVSIIMDNLKFAKNEHTNDSQLLHIPVTAVHSAPENRKASFTSHVKATSPQPSRKSQFNHLK
jgi:hypothetical protein